MRVLHPLLLGKGATHKRSTLSNNSESDLIYSLPPPSDISLTSIPTDLDSMFPRPSSPPLSHNSESDIIYSFSLPSDISLTSSVPYATTVPRSRHFNPIPVPANSTNAKAAAYLSSHDVQDFVNSTASLTSSPATRTYGQFSNLPETSVSSSSQLLTNHVKNHPIRRPRTHTKVFQTSKDLAAYYGIPPILPPQEKHISPTSTHLTDFHTLSSNYLSMQATRLLKIPVISPVTSPP